MLSRDKILRETSPLSIFFVKSGSSGNRLLFRYPYDESFQTDPDLAGFVNNSEAEPDWLQFKSVINESDDALCNMFSVHSNLCGQKFEIKINSIRHVGHPISLLQSNQNHITDPSSETLPGHHTRSTQASRGDTTSFNIVCALRVSAGYDIVDCYHDLSKRLAIALSYEERRCSYLANEIKTMLSTLEERDMANLASRDHLETLDNGIAAEQNSDSSTRESNSKSVFDLILERSRLARDLKKVFISLSTTGIVDLKINNWINVSFCLPQKVHRLQLMTHTSMPVISTHNIKRCLLYLRPYHGMLLLQEPRVILDSLPIDASPAFIQLIKVTKPEKNFMDLSVDSNLTLMQIFCIVSQLIYWSKATIIYPICNSNIYAIHPLASTGLRSKLVSDFRTRFPNNKPLHHYLSLFSESTSLSQLNGPLLSVAEKSNLLSIVTWLLQRRILIQIHTYIFLVFDRKEDRSTMTKNPAFHLANQTTASESNNSSPQGIEINYQPRNGPLKISSVISANSIDSSPQLFKNSLTESLEGSMRRFRADSLAESQEDTNFGLNSSLSSTPNSNMEYPSPSSDINNRSTISSSCPLDQPLGLPGTETTLSELKRAGLSQAAAGSVMAIPASRNPEDLRFFLRLLPYFDGKHHVEDIMFFENLERSRVLILCDKFRDILFTCHYEDVAVHQLSPLV